MQGDKTNPEAEGFGILHPSLTIYHYVFCVWLPSRLDL